MTSHADLKRLATEANQDEWTAATMEQCTGTQPQPWGQVINLPRVYVDRCQFFTPEDARYIAAVRPTKVLALLEENERLYASSGILLNEKSRLRDEVVRLRASVNAVAQMSIDEPSETQKAEDAIENQKLFGNKHTTPMVRVEAVKYAALLERIARLEKIEDAAKEFRTAYAINRDVGGGRGYELVIQREIELITALASAEQEKNG